MLGVRRAIWTCHLLGWGARPTPFQPKETPPDPINIPVALQLTALEAPFQRNANLGRMLAVRLLSLAEGMCHTV